MDQALINEARHKVEMTSWRIHLIIPSILAPGENFALKATAFGPDELPAPLDQTIKLEAIGSISGLPESITFKGTDGTLTIDGLKAGEPGTAWINAIAGNAPAAVSSNPCWIQENPAYRIFWGDIHIHTTYSNCSAWACKDPAFAYEYARDVSYLDFAAAADHLRGIHSDENRWPRLQELSKKYHAPGSFIPILGLESSHKTGFGGDINAYYENDDAPYFWVEREDMKGIAPEVTLSQLWDFLDNSGSPYITIPHHTSRSGKYRDFSDPAYDAQREPVFEIYSMWGSSEMRWNRFPLRAGNTDRPSYFRDALMQGCRYGVIASSDDHTTMPAAQNRPQDAYGLRRLSDYHHRGLTAVRVPELSRSEIFKALRNRCCYATTFARTLLDFSLHDIPMGQVVSADSTLQKTREFTVKAANNCGHNSQITLIRNDTEIETKPLDTETGSITFVDRTPLSENLVQGAQHHPDPFTVYYIRMQDQGNQTQWSSPIWIES